MKEFDELRTVLGSSLLQECEVASGHRFFQVFSERLPAAVEFLAGSGKWSFLFCFSSLRRPPFRLMYGFSSGGRTAVLECSAGEGNAAFPSIAHLISTAYLFEAEIKSISGLAFSGLEESSSGEAPEGRVDTGDCVLSPGDILPLMLEPAGFKVILEDERVRKVRWDGFFIRRRIETLGEEVLDFRALPLAAERICALSGFSHSTAFCRAVEAAIGLEVPPRARAIRYVLLRLARIGSHLLWLGLAGRVAGFETFYMQIMRLREPLMWLAESLCGNRMNFGLNLVGGLRNDIRPEGLSELVITLEELEHDLARFIRAFMKDSSFLRKFENLGILSQEKAVRVGASGAVARASGVAVFSPEETYFQHGDQAVSLSGTECSGDALARLRVRLEEIQESIDSIRSVVGSIPEGPVFDEAAGIIPGREGLGIAEGPEGEVVHFVHTGDGKLPSAWRVRSPEIMNLQAGAETLGGTTKEDLPAALWSFNPCFSCIER